jgi:hypothetical protein
MAVNSGDALFRASTFAACPGVNNPRGLIHNDAATIGEIDHPVAGSTARGAVTIVGIGAVFGSGAGGNVTTLAPLARRHCVRSRSRWEKLPVSRLAGGQARLTARSPRGHHRGEFRGASIPV